MGCNDRLKQLPKFIANNLILNDNFHCRRFFSTDKHLVLKMNVKITKRFYICQNYYLLPSSMRNATYLIAFVWVVSDFDSPSPVVARLSILRNLCIALIVSSSPPFFTGWSSLLMKLSLLLLSCVNTIGTKSWPEKYNSSINNLKNGGKSYNQQIYSCQQSIKKRFSVTFIIPKLSKLPLNFTHKKKVKQIAIIKNYSIVLQLSTSLLNIFDII